MLSRIQLAFSVYAFGALGVFLAVVPWTPVWDAATLLLAHAGAGAWIRSGWARGLVLGLGGLDLVVALADAGTLARALRRPGGPAEGDGA